MRKRLIGNIAALGTIQLANYVAPFVVLVHLSKTLGLEIYGILAFAQAIAAIISVFLDFGYGLSATNKISINRSNKTYVGKLLGGIIAVQLIIFLLCVLFIFLFINMTEKYSEHRIIFYLICVPILMQGLMPTWFFQGIEKMKYIVVTTIAAKILSAICILFLIRVPSDYIWVPLLNGAGQMIALVLAVFFIFRLGYKIKFPSLKTSIYSLKMSRHFFASRIAVASYMNSALLVLGIIAQPAVVAIYSMAEQLYRVMQSALGTAAAGTYPYMSKEKDSPLMIKLIIGVVAIAAVGAAIGYFLAPLLIALVFDESWLASIPVFNIFLLAIVVHACTVMTGYPLAALVDRLDVANASVITGAVIYYFLLIIIFLTNSVTPLILAFIMMISEIAVLLHRLLLLIPIVIKKINLNPPQGNTK